MSDSVLAAIGNDREAILGRLKALLRIPSVSTDPAYLQHIAAAQTHLAERLKAAGLGDVRLLDSVGHKPVYAEWLGAPDAPTILVYGHYDVQPPDPLDKWQSPPFEPTIRDNRLYARGVSDDKGPLSVALEVICAFLAVEGKLPVNIKLLIEGEEELGSRNLSAVIAQNSELLAADFVLSADGARWRADLPSVNISSRGIATLQVTLRTAAKDLHSGRYGGAVANPLNALSRLIASLHDDSGRIAVAGFYDGVAEPSAAERAAIAALPFDERAYLVGVGATASVGERGYTLLERQWLRPCLDLNGMWGGYQGPGGKTVIPCEAHAKLSSRLVAGQDPKKISAALKQHLTAKCPQGATVSFAGEGHGSPAYSLPTDHPGLATVEAVLAELNGRRPVRVRIGATLPVSEMFARELGIDTVMFSFSTADEDFHAPNEFFRLDGLDQGLAAWTRCLRKLGTQKREAYDRFRR